MIWVHRKRQNYNLKDELESAIKRIECFIEENDLCTLKQGTHEINGRDLYVNISEYSTGTPNNCMWEAHKKYIDVHYMIFGREMVQIRDGKEEDILKYIEESDLAEIKNAAADTCLLLQNEGMLILFPSDVHMTGIRVGDESKLVRKAVFKIKMR